MNIHTALLFTAILSCIGTAASQTPGEPEVPVVQVTGTFASELRAYRHYYPGLVEYEKYRWLAPEARLRFAMARPGMPLRPVPITRASLEKNGKHPWSLDLPVSDDGWFTIPVSEEAYEKEAAVVVSKRNAQAAKWVLEVQTPGLKWNVFRLGDLRLLCHVYIAIDWARNERAGRILPNSMGMPPERACDQPGMIYFNPGDWPRLKGYRITEKDERISYLVNGKALPDFINIVKDHGAWSPDALVEFILPDRSHWKTDDAQD